MIDNLRHWKSLCETDPKYTKQFTRSGGFKGTAQNPTYAIKKMTDTFGPAGMGWGTGKPEFQFVSGPDGETLVYCTLSLWYLDDGKINTVWGVGGDSAVLKNSYGIKCDDEACKKSFTDAMTNAMKFIGMAADLHLGMFDDSKYVNDLKAKLGEDVKGVGAPGNQRTGNKLLDKAFEAELGKINACDNLERLQEVYRLSFKHCRDSGCTEDQINLLMQQKDNRKAWLSDPVNQIKQ